MKGRFTTRIIVAVGILLLTAFDGFASGIPSGGKLVRAEELAPGVQLRQYEFGKLYGGSQFVSVAQIELDRPGLVLGIGVCNDRTRMTLGEMARRDHALLAINSGYFFMADPSAPAGALKHGGVTESTGDIGNGVGGVVAFTGGRVEIRPLSELQSCLSHENFRAGFPLLVNRGAICANLGESEHALDRHPRTAVGLDNARHFYWVTFDGRADGRADGVDCRSLADFMRQLGCEYALNMDGGGSTMMWARPHGIVNHPSDNHRFDAAGERVIYDSLYIRTVNPSKK
ncbi:MAG: phosphodiester glycosidase family protein [Victivallaceae bacterium]|nr:phosphodiester glycosidase family protein [Victivallaceae bacterium]